MEQQDVLDLFSSQETFEGLRSACLAFLGNSNNANLEFPIVNSEQMRIYLRKDNSNTVTITISNNEIDEQDIEESIDVEEDEDE